MSPNVSPHRVAKLTCLWVGRQAVKDFQFEQGAGLIGKAGLTSWGKYMLPFWSCGVLAYVALGQRFSSFTSPTFANRRAAWLHDPYPSSCRLCITLYVFVREVYLEWMENFFFYDEFTIFEHLNPGTCRWNLLPHLSSLRD